MESEFSSLLPEQFGPLQGVRILSSGTIVAEPFAAEMAAEMGAEVIHIERPNLGNLLWRTTEFPIQGQDDKPVSSFWIQERRNMLHITLDFSKPEGRGFEIVESRFGKRVPEGLADQFYSRMDVAFRRDLKPVPGVVEALDKISLPMCVASSGPRHMMQTTLGVTGLLERFEGRIFSAVDVGRGKPFPDLFLHAAERMRANPEQCVVVEDAVTGVQAAVAARMSVLGYADHSTRELLERAGATVFPELPCLMIWLNYLHCWGCKLWPVVRNGYIEIELASLQTPGE